MAQYQNYQNYPPTYGQPYMRQEIQQPVPVLNMQQGFQVRPVTSKEEALAVPVEYFGPGTLMPDIGHEVVYLKRFNANTGASDLMAFVRMNEPSVEPTNEIQELKDAVAQLRADVDKMKKARTVKKDDADE